MNTLAAPLCQRYGITVKLYLLMYKPTVLSLTLLYTINSN